jgi:hypothetical protein
MTVFTLLPLFRELNDLKRIRVAGHDGSLAERLFLRSWARLVGGASLTEVALSETASAVAAARLAGIDAEVLAAGGLPAGERLAVLQSGFNAVAGPLDDALRTALRGVLSPDPLPEANPLLLPPFAPLLAHQPRAGATRPGFRRVALEPAENHADHCGMVAVYGVLAAPLYGADPTQGFLTGLAHHLHNAFLPDAGDAGDVLLGDKLKPLIESFRAKAIAELPGVLHQPVKDAISVVYESGTPSAKAFQTADVLDRVLEMEWHASSAAFTLGVALEDMDIVHPGPVQAFQMEIMRQAELMPLEMMPLESGHT